MQARRYRVGLLEPPPAANPQLSAGEPLLFLRRMVGVDQQRLAYRLPALVLRSTEVLLLWLVEGLQVPTLAGEGNRQGILPKGQGLVLLERQPTI